MVPSRTWVLAASLLLAATFAGSGTFGDETDYQERDIHGWRIVIEARLAESPSLVAPMIEKLEAQLFRIAANVPSPQVDRLRKTPIWLVQTDPYMEAQDFLGLYHFSAEWLVENGYPSELHQAIQFDQRFGREYSPSIVFHQLAYAYHDRKLGLENPRIIELHEQAKTEAAGALDGCPRHDIPFAFTDVEEFFATFSQAWLGGTCFYPRNRNVIRLMHPEMSDYLNEVWGF
ncbi:MAG: hypothetical protein F4Y60_01425 [Boseongicola sp. SB0664_bin_43]|uniref:Uncharacterized protein n=1 Tax=Boseongicola sp. SB0664_bin_43 TaxID=2604844 RepID=A0A6B0XWQ8_9RHOB|nr:hypothetical protein [Boseongicola sp. SB0664_bin_43]MYK31784.1 hypothetical protein [Boseongicola sp. SB0670_bin_30]